MTKEKEKGKVLELVLDDELLEAVLLNPQDEIVDGLDRIRESIVESKESAKLADWPLDVLQKARRLETGVKGKIAGIDLLNPSEA